MGVTTGPSTTLRTFRRRSHGWRGPGPSAALRMFRGRRGGWRRRGPWAALGTFRRAVEVVGMVLWRPGQIRAIWHNCSYVAGNVYTGRVI